MSKPSLSSATTKSPTRARTAEPSSDRSASPATAAPTGTAARTWRTEPPNTRLDDAVFELPDGDTTRAVLMTYLL